MRKLGNSTNKDSKNGQSILGDIDCSTAEEQIRDYSKSLYMVGWPIIDGKTTITVTFDIDIIKGRSFSNLENIIFGYDQGISTLNLTRIPETNKQHFDILFSQTHTASNGAYNFEWLDNASGGETGILVTYCGTEKQIAEYTKQNYLAFYSPLKYDLRGNIRQNIVCLPSDMPEPWVDQPLSVAGHEFLHASLAIADLYGSSDGQEILNIINRCYRTTISAQCTTLMAPGGYVYPSGPCTQTTDPIYSWYLHELGPIDSNVFVPESLNHDPRIYSDTFETEITILLQSTIVLSASALTYCLLTCFKNKLTTNLSRLNQQRSSTSINGLLLAPLNPSSDDPEDPSQSQSLQPYTKKQTCLITATKIAPLILPEMLTAYILNGTWYMPQSVIYSYLSISAIVALTSCSTRPFTQSIPFKIVANPVVRLFTMYIAALGMTGADPITIALIVTVMLIPYLTCGCITTLTDRNIFDCSSILFEPPMEDTLHIEEIKHNTNPLQETEAKGHEDQDPTSIALTSK